MSNTTLGLLRHGQTDWNINLRLQGTADIPMNATGVAQIELAAQKLCEQPWDVILSSPWDGQCTRQRSLPAGLELRE